MKKRIVAICGSTRKESVNLTLIRIFADLSKDYFDVIIYNSIDELPHFNPDHDKGLDSAPEVVKKFRQLLTNADGILICTPEYAMGVPGTLKNAIDWTVSSCEFNHKPTALITASTLGEKAHASLLETLTIIEANVTRETQLHIPHIKTHITSDGSIKDRETGAALTELINRFNEKVISK